MDKTDMRLYESIHTAVRLAGCVIPMLWESVIFMVNTADIPGK